MVHYDVQILPRIDFQGRAVAVVVAKAAWTVGEDRVPRPDEAPQPILFADVLVDGEDPVVSPVLMEADTALLKDRTDIIVHGAAYAPDGTPVGAFDVTVAAGSHRRTLRVFGPRTAVWQKPSGKTPTPPLFTDPTPVRKVAIDFRNAYGGPARYRIPNQDEVVEIPCPVNPLGKGYCVQNSPEGLDGLALPQIEAPDALLTPESIVRPLGAPEDLPVAAGFGVYGSSWYPRVAWFGVLPHEVPQVKASVADMLQKMDPVKDEAAIAMMQDYAPPTMAGQFYQAAAPGMSVPLLAGNEPFILKNLTPGGLLGFDLPGRTPQVSLDRGDGPRNVTMALDTVVFLAETGRLILTWRGRLALDGPGDFDRLPAMPRDVRDGSVLEAARLAEGNAPRA